MDGGMYSVDLGMCIQHMCRLEGMGSSARLEGMCILHPVGWEATIADLARGDCEGSIAPNVGPWKSQKHWNGIRAPTTTTWPRKGVV